MAFGGAPRPLTPQSFLIDGPAGKLETVLAEPDSGHPRGIAIVAHPHPLYGGTMDNKVVYTLFKALLELGFITVKFNFRGVGQSGGTTIRAEWCRGNRRRGCGGRDASKINLLPALTALHHYCWQDFRSEALFRLMPRNGSSRKE